jgi:hypothetical protein
MSHILQSARTKLLHFIDKYRMALRVLVLAGTGLLVADAFVFQRSLLHALVGHSAVFLLLLLALLVIEMAPKPESERDG